MLKTFQYDHSDSRKKNVGFLMMFLLSILRAYMLPIRVHFWICLLTRI